MRRFSRAMVLASLALFSLALLAGTAVANRSILIEGIETRGAAITLTNEGEISFVEPGGFSTRCRSLVLTGTLARVIPKRVGEHVGEIQHGVAERCTGPLGEGIGAIVLAEPIVNARRHPFPLVYVAFLGTLPRINGIQLNAQRAAFLLERVLNIMTCLYEDGGTVPALIEFSGEPPRSGRGRFLRNNTRRKEGPVECPPEGELRGEFRLTPQIVLRLL